MLIAVYYHIIIITIIIIMRSAFKHTKEEFKEPSRGEKSLFL